MPRTTPSLLRVSVAVVALLGLLAVGLEVVGSASASGGGLPVPTSADLRAIRYGEPPLKVLLLGDSVAGSLGVGLSELAPAYNVELVNAGHPGCSVSSDGQILLTYFPAVPGQPCVLDQPDALFAAWRSWIAAFRPDVVLYVARSDLLEQQIHGKWTWIGHRDFNAWLSSRLKAFVRLGSVDGAKVVLMTVPVSHQSVARLRPEDNPLRVARDAAIERGAVASDPSHAATFDLSQLLTPGLHYRASVDGLELHCADGVHLTPTAGILTAVTLFPWLWSIAGSHRVAGGGRWIDGLPLPSGTPRWYSKLAC